MKLHIFPFLTLLALIASLSITPVPAQAASLTVDSLADSISVDGLCTLREAMQNATNNATTNADCSPGSGADMITFSVSGVIVIATPLPNIMDTAGLTIDGAGQSVTISGNDLTSVFYLHTNVPLTLNHLTISDGYTAVYGAAIDSYGALTVSDCVFSANRANNYAGGAIYNHSNVVNITSSTFSNNSAAGAGGGIYSLAGSVTITGSSFSDNSAADGGGVFCYDCTMDVSGSTFTNNNTPNGAGGAINNSYGPLTISDSVFSGNGASYGAGGGAIHNHGGTLKVTGSSFSANSASGSPGGAIFNDDTMDIALSTFTGNSAGTGGGIHNEGPYATIANSTFSGNSASLSGTNGGGVFNTGKLTITNSTISANTAPSGGGIGRSAGTLTLRNTIVASNPGGNCSGTITNGAANIDDGTTCGWGTANGSLSSTDPLLGALSGTPAYYPLNPGSPAVDQGDDSICAASPVNNQSQNGVTRPQGTHCDIGSYEQGDVTPPLVQSITRLDVNPTSAASVRFSVVFTEAVSGVDVGDFALTVSGISGTAITGVSGGTTSYTVTVSTGSGLGTIRLDLLDDDTIADQAANPLGGAGAGNGSFTAGETYTVRFPQINLPLVKKK